VNEKDIRKTLELNLAWNKTPTHIQKAFIITMQDRRTYQHERLYNAFKLFLAGWEKSKNDNSHITQKEGIVKFIVEVKAPKGKQALIKSYIENAITEWNGQFIPEDCKDTKFLCSLKAKDFTVKWFHKWSNKHERIRNK
jgi:hypothetical protein